MLTFPLKYFVGGVLSFYYEKKYFRIVLDDWIVKNLQIQKVHIYCKKKIEFTIKCQLYDSMLQKNYCILFTKSKKDFLYLTFLKTVSSIITCIKSERTACSTM